MATIPISRKAKPLEIDKFLGYHNEQTGDTQIKLGESGAMSNYYITKNWKLKKIDGYEEIFEDLGSRIQGMFYGAVNGTVYFVFACDGNVYTHDLVGGLNTSIGTLTDAPTNFFTFSDKLYMQNGVEYKSWDGTTFQDVEGYVPTVAINTPYSGGGTDYENVNLLNDSKIQYFDGDNAQATYQLRELAITSVDRVIKDGVTQTLTTDYTVNLTNGTVTFVVNPQTSENNVEIEWTKTSSPSNSDLITGHRGSMLFGPGNDTRVFIFGNTDERHRYRYSSPENPLGSTEATPSAEYFPTTNFSDQDSENFAITDMQRTQANYFVIFKENMSRYGRYNITIDTNGDEITTFPTFNLNGVVGNKPFNQARVLDDTVHSIETNAIHRWDSTEVDDERNAPRVSSKIRANLEALDMTAAVTFDWQDRSEMWVAVGSKVFIYNYQLLTKSEEDGNRHVGTYSVLDMADEATSFVKINNKLYMGTETGTIMEFDPSFDDFNGELINRHWEMNFYDFDANWKRKSMHRFWIQMFPDVRESLSIELITNKGRESGTGVQTTIEYKNFDYGDVDYSDWSYTTSYNAQPFRVKRKAKKFTNLKLVFDNTDLDGATILNITIKFTYQGESK